MKKQSIWISYDLGVRGDYEGMYAWIDSHGGKECGDSLALIEFQYNTSLLDELKNELSNAVELTKKSRIYIIYTNSEKNKPVGRFLFGSRGIPPWEGFSEKRGETVEDEG